MKHKATNTIFYYLIRTLMFPFYCLPYRTLHQIGKCVGSLAYYVAPKDIRKITLNNLALAKSLNLSEQQIKKISKESFQNLIINGIEYFRLKRSFYKMDRFVKGHNTQVLDRLAKEKKGAICVTGHISNWELCFLAYTQKQPSIAIGKKIKNSKLYQYIQSIRTMHGGEIIDMKQAISHGIKSLRKGRIFSMVNDQAYTGSSYSYPFFGARAWTSTAPALMAYKANVPIIIVTTTRLEGGRYEYTLSDPIWPNTDLPLKKEVYRLMDTMMQHFEAHIKKHPGQWLWQHKRWKQEGFNIIHNKYKADSILFVMPFDKKRFEYINKSIWMIPQIYPKTFLTFMVPQKFEKAFSLKDQEVIVCKTPADIYIRDYRFQMIYDFTSTKQVRKHFMKLGAHTVFNFENFSSESDIQTKPFESCLKSTVCFPTATFTPPSYQEVATTSLPKEPTTSTSGKGIMN